MATHDNDPVLELNAHVRRLTGWRRFFAVVYRVILTLGLLLLFAFTGLVFLTGRSYAWTLVFPILLIALGIFLAWVEYRLHMRLYSLNNQELSDSEE